MFDLRSYISYPSSSHVRCAQLYFLPVILLCASCADICLTCRLSILGVIQGLSAVVFLTLHISIHDAVIFFSSSFCYACRAQVYFVPSSRKFTPYTFKELTSYWLLLIPVLTLLAYYVLAGLGRWPGGVDIPDVAAREPTGLQHGGDSRATCRLSHLYRYISW